MEQFASKLLSKDLALTDADRGANIRRVSAASQLMVDAGLIVLTTFISPFRPEGRKAREMLQPGEFIEVVINTFPAAAEKRDFKGLYGKARRGELRNFTGIDSPYESQEHPEVLSDPTMQVAKQAAVQSLDNCVIALCSTRYEHNRDHHSVT